MQLAFTNHPQFNVPDKLKATLNREIGKLEQTNPTANAITFNFRDPKYDAEFGGYHPVEIRLEKNHQQWRFAYITDFAYYGHPFAELVKEIDVCFVTESVYLTNGKKVPTFYAKQLIYHFLSNFVEYYRMDVYQVKISFD